MSRTTCKHCGTEANNDIEKCPQCGSPLTTRLSRTAKALFVIVLVVLIAAGAFMVLVEDDPATPSNGTTVVEPVPTLPEDGEREQ